MKCRIFALVLALILLVPWLCVPALASEVTILCSGDISMSTSDAVGFYIDSDYNLFIYGSGASETYTYKSYSSFLDDIVSVTVQSDVTSLSYAFYGMGSQCVSWNFSDSLTAFSLRCFADCTFSSISLPDSVTSLGNSCFYGCVNLTSFTFPASIDSIGPSCFAYCSSLTSVYFVSDTPPSYVESNIFTGCPSSLVIHVPSDSYDAYCAAMPEYAAFIVADGTGAGGGSTGGGVWDDGYFYSMTVSHEIKDAYYWDSGVQFTALLVGGPTDADRSVTWSVDGSAILTDITDDGFLTIGTEYKPYLTVTATSVAYPSLSASAIIPITQSTEADAGAGEGMSPDLQLKLEGIDADIGNLQISMDAVQDTMDEINTGGERGPELSDGSSELSQVASDLGELEYSLISSLQDGFAEVGPQLDYSNYYLGLQIISLFLQMLWDNIPFLRLLYSIPLALGVFYYLCSHVPYVTSSGRSASKRSALSSGGRSK